ncbi:MAG: metallophosphoesterase [Clostridiales bacterium]|nr:metallophosphoesterase [Clostridiales bacterium]
MENILRIICFALCFIGAVGVIGFFAGAFSGRMEIVHYTVKSGKVQAKVRFLLIADLHSFFYGEGQGALIAAIKEQSPDVIFMAGDIVDDRYTADGAEVLLSAVGRKYPCCYVIGNHEHGSGRVDEIKELFSSLGAYVLAGDCRKINIKGQNLSLCGVDDPYIGEEEFYRQLERCGRLKSRQGFSVLLSHRPERIADYSSRGFDLVLCGHAHGGQVRIPFVLNGLYAPHQGVFPKYAGGKYDFKGSVMIVSRGLAKKPRPRIFNRPELVVVDIVPEE